MWLVYEIFRSLVRGDLIRGKVCVESIIGYGAYCWWLSTYPVKLSGGLDLLNWK